MARVQICTLKKEGYTEREFAKCFMVSNKGVHYTLKRPEETGSHDDRKRSGRKRVSTKSEDEQIIVTSERDRQNSLRVHVCTQTGSTEVVVPWYGDILHLLN